MDILNVTPPEVNPVTKAKGFWKQLGMLVLGTTVSLVLTFGTAQLINKGQRAKDRRWICRSKRRNAILPPLW